MQTRFFVEKRFHLQPFSALCPVTQAHFFYLQTFHFYDCKKRDGKGFFLAKLQSIKLHTQSVTRPLVYGQNKDKVNSHTAIPVKRLSFLVFTRFRKNRQRIWHSNPLQSFYYPQRKLWRTVLQLHKFEGKSGLISAFIYSSLLKGKSCLLAVEETFLLHFYSQNVKMVTNDKYLVFHLSYINFYAKKVFLYKNTF